MGAQKRGIMKAVMLDNPPRLPPGIVQTDPPDEESRHGRELGTQAKVTWSWLKSKFKGQPAEPAHDRDYWNGKWGRLYILVRPFDADGKWLDGLRQEFTSDALRDAEKYGIELMKDRSDVDGFWIDGSLDKYWTETGQRRDLRVISLGRYERARQSPNAQRLQRKPDMEPNAGRFGIQFADGSWKTVAGGSRRRSFKTEAAALRDLALDLDWARGVGAYSGRPPDPVAEADFLAARVVPLDHAPNPRRAGASFGEAKTGVEREKGGRFAAVPKCDFCGKPITGEHYSDTRICGGSDGPGFYLCDRKRCSDKRERFEQDHGLQALGEHYAAQRAANEGLTPNAGWRTRRHGGQFDHDDMSLMCECGHRLGHHGIGTGKPGSRRVCQYGTGHEDEPPGAEPCDCENFVKARRQTPNATIYGRKFHIRRGYLLVPQQMTGPDDKTYEVDLEYQVFDAETGEPVQGTQVVEGEQHGDRLVIGDPHRDTRLFEYSIAAQPTSESENRWRGYRAALGDRQWHQEGKSKKYVGQSQAWWDGYNDGHRDKRDPNAGYTANGGYYVWVLNRSGEPLSSEGPYGPYDLENGKTFARISATEGDHDRAVSRGLDPQSPSFEVVRRYQSGTGERVL